MKKWSPDSWQQYSYLQAATYNDQEQLQKVVAQLNVLPPLVTSGEIKNLKKAIALAGRGEAFILQGGDCAESFNDCRSDIISNKLKIILQMSLVLLHGLHKPIIRVGRIAGQYAKPRSSDFETIDGVTLPSYRGDIVNSPEFTQTAREPNPKLLLQAYSCAAMTLNFIRALLDGGFADLNHPQLWDLRFVEHSKQKDEYQAIVKSIADALDFLEVIDGTRSSNLNKVDFYTSHEALHLHYEQALTRKLKDGNWYNLSTHLPWIGMRTAQADSAHLEFLRGVQNPIGIKIGPTASPEWLAEILEIANPNKEEGRLVLFTRLGAKHIDELLPPLIEAVQRTKCPVTWSCDPMHGNTETTANGIKTRHFDNILFELK
ncbi:MAG: 3-deoxy-7-phosphoheptulonate synthase, partial [Legionella sp.]